jgi:hypothetical protein
VTDYRYIFSCQAGMFCGCIRTQYAEECGATDTNQNPINGNYHTKPQSTLRKTDSYKLLGMPIRVNSSIIKRFLLICDLCGFV